MFILLLQMLYFTCPLLINALCFGIKTCGFET